jgi:hypothetical protein
MGLEVYILLGSLDAGQTEDTIQFAMVRYLQSAFSNVYHVSSQHETGMAVLAHKAPKHIHHELPILQLLLQMLHAWYPQKDW